MNIKANDNYRSLKESYLFSEIASRVRRYSEAFPEKNLIRLGIGDVTLPLAPVVTKAMADAALEMGVRETFRGYPPECGYEFLRGTIAEHYKGLGADVNISEIFVSDGAKSDLGNLTDILGANQVIIPDPVYPVYVDSNIMAGNGIFYLQGNEENGFLPEPDGLSKDKASVIYLCSPNNPTGACYNKAQLARWVDYALDTGSLIIFDSAYEAFITGDDIPHTIYEIEGARECAIEVCSFSKVAGFTGVRCGWTVVPDKLSASGGASMNKMWFRRQSTKFNGVSYPVQRAAQAALSAEGKRQCFENIGYYRRNASMIAQVMTSKGIFFTGGTNSPYIWLKVPGGMGSWEFFDRLLNDVQIVGTPGEGFGQAGDKYFRLTSFGTCEDTSEACKRLSEYL